MTHFRSRPGSKSATRILKHPFPDSAAFSAVVQALLTGNPLGCTSYYALRKKLPTRYAGTRTVYGKVRVS